MRWMNFVGGRYSVPAFIEEATKIGVSRRVPRHSKVEYGDSVILARHGTAHSFAFGEMIVTRLTLEQGVAEKVTEKLIEQGKTVTVKAGNPVPIKRACGEYTVMSITSIDASLQEVKAAALEVNPKAMILIGGQFVKIPHFSLIPNPKFSRGLIKCRYDFSEASAWDRTAELAGVEGYQKY